MTVEEQHQATTLAADGWNFDSIVFCVLLARLTKVPIPGIALLWLRATDDLESLKLNFEERR